MEQHRTRGYQSGDSRPLVKVSCFWKVTVPWISHPPPPASKWKMSGTTSQNPRWNCIVQMDRGILKKLSSQIHRLLLTADHLSGHVPQILQLSMLLLRVSKLWSFLLWLSTGKWRPVPLKRPRFPGADALSWANITGFVCGKTMLRSLDHWSWGVAFVPINSRTRSLFCIEA